MSQPTKVPRVFISYSHDSPEHKAHTLALTQHLRKTNKIDAWIDQFDEDQPPHSWPDWMFQQLDRADFVIMICSEKYKRRVHDQEEPGSGYGARWEGAVIAHSLYSAVSFAETSPYIPVVFDEADVAHRPYFVGGASYYHVNPADMSGLARLVSRLLGERTVVPVPLTGQEATDKKPQPVHGEQERAAAAFPDVRKVLGQKSQEIADAKGDVEAIADSHSRRQRMRNLLEHQLPYEADDVKGRMVHLIFAKAAAEFEAAEVDESGEHMERLIRRVHIEALDTQNKWRANAPWPGNSDAQHRPHAREAADPQDVRFLIEAHYPNISNSELDAMRSVLSGINRQQLNAMMSDADAIQKIFDQLRRSRR